MANNPAAIVQWGQALGPQAGRSNSVPNGKVHGFYPYSEGSVDAWNYLHKSRRAAGRERCIFLNGRHHPRLKGQGDVGCIDRISSWSPPPPRASVERQSVDLISKGLEPITSYPQTYQQMREEAQQQMSTGVGQIAEGLKYAASPTPESATGSEGIDPLFRGVGNVATGAAGYVFSPISAGLRTVIGKPLEENVGIPKEYSEFATSLAIPGMGMTKVPSTASKVVAELPKISAAADVGYDAVRASNVVINPDAARILADQIERRLIEAGYRPIRILRAKASFSIVDELRNPMSNRQVMGPNLSVQTASSPADLEAMRKALNAPVEIQRRAMPFELPPGRLLIFIVRCRRFEELWFLAMRPK